MLAMSSDILESEGMCSFSPLPFTLRMKRVSIDIL